MNKKVKIVLGLVSVLVLGYLLCSSHPDSITEAKNVAIATDIIDQVSGSHATLVMASETNRTMTVHVDMSSSMNGYARETNNVDTTFLRVLEFLVNQPDARLQLLSSDYHAPNDYAQGPDLLKQPGKYTGDLSMADAIRQFANEPERMHVFVTDSQPWDSGTKPAYGRVAESINEFLTTGGRCALLLYRSAYLGLYSSPIKKAATQDAQVLYDCTNRPFAVWIFSPPGGCVNELAGDLMSKPGAFKCEQKIEFAQPGFTVSLTNRTLPKPELGEKYGSLIGQLEPRNTGKEIGRVKDYVQIKIKKDVLSGPEEYVPLQFDLRATNYLKGRSLSSISNNLSVFLECWEIPDNFPPEASATSRSESNAKSLSNAVSRQSHYLKSAAKYDVEYTLQFQTNTQFSAETTSAPESARLVVQVKRPGNARRYGWVMTIRSRDRGASISLPAGFSTPDDQYSADCDKILRLDDVVHEVAEKTEKIGAILFVTEYPSKKHAN